MTAPGVSPMKKWGIFRKTAIVISALFSALAPLGAATIEVDSGEVPIDINGKCSLREAIINANNDADTHMDCASGSGSDTIRLELGMYSLDDVDNYYYGPNGLPPIESTITIEGQGAILERTSNAPPFRFFFVAVGDEPAFIDPQIATLGTGDLTLLDLTLKNGYVRGGEGGAGFRGGGGGAGLGGAIYNRGTLRIERCTLTENLAEGGAGGRRNDANTGAGGGGGLSGRGDPNHGGGGGWAGDGQDGAARAGGGGPANAGRTSVSVTRTNEGSPRRAAFLLLKRAARRGHEPTEESCRL